ncbi:MAG: hypothetical protein NWE95_01910 [Candidatus Bathyarchaeota archaeon]|nr:hypothetical protein [Candidatus Bathyarchaeota archaeon]
MKCSVCEEKIDDESELFYGDYATYYEGKPLCESCYYEDDPVVTVYFNREDCPHIISYTRNETKGIFRAKWHSTDPWRGYYETESNEYALVNTAELLAYHESEKMLKKFDERVRKLFEENNIDYARVFARSSNVFYQNYDLYVKKEQAIPAALLVAKAKNEVDYNNAKWYRNMIFDESSLNKLAELFPERTIETDHDAANLLEELGDKTLSELQDRLKKGVK